MRCQVGDGGGGDVWDVKILSAVKRNTFSDAKDKEEGEGEGNKERYRDPMTRHLPDTTHKGM